MGKKPGINTWLFTSQNIREKLLSFLTPYVDNMDFLLWNLPDQDLFSKQIWAVMAFLQSLDHLNDQSLASLSFLDE